MYQFTPKLRSRILAQYSDDHHGNNVGISALAAYDFTSRSAAYVGYNRQQRSPLDPSDLGDSIFGQDFVLAVFLSLFAR
jgi:predicted porin